MPAVSQKQQMLFAMVLHHPEKFKGKKYDSLKHMAKKTLREYATTKRKGLPMSKEGAKSRHKRAMR